MMTASARHAETPRGADALHKMAAAAAASAREDPREAGGDENAPANGNKPAKKEQSESDENGDDDEDDEDDDDETNGKAKSVASSASATDRAGGDDDDKKASKKSRRELPPHTVAILKGWMLSPEHVKHPYPTDEDKQMLLKKTGINMKQLTNWFTNARKRIWKPMMRREHSRQLQTAMEYEKTRGGVPTQPPFPMAPPMPYRDAAGAYPPRPAIRHSFDAGSLGAPPHPRDAMGYAHAYDGSMPMAPPPHPQAPGAYPVPPPPHAYPPRVVRSVSESATRHDMDDYIDAMRIRKRVHEMAPEGVDGGDAHADKRFRRGPGLSPRCVQILHDWVAKHAHMEYPTPADSDKLQLSRDTGLDVQQIELWFKTNVGRHGALLQPQQPPPTAQPPQATMPHGHPGYRSIPSRDNPLYPPPPAYGERGRSIPSQGNPMFPPRPTQRSSIPGAGNPQFPPPPGVRRDSSDGFRGGMPPPGYPGTSGVYPPPPRQGYEADAARPMRTLSINSAQYAQSSGSAAVPMPSIPTPVGAPGGGNTSGLPSLTGRPLPGAGGRPGPPMGQARDSRSHTLDMGQFADARRRKMNFQDILASTSAPQMPPHGLQATPSRPNGENAYPTEVPAPYAQKVYEQQQQQQQRVGMPAPTHAPSADAQAPGSRI